MTRHAREHPVPIGGASSVEAISWLHWAPLPPDMGSCRYEACCCDEHCTCQESPVGIRSRRAPSARSQS